MYTMSGTFKSTMKVFKRLARLGPNRAIKDPEIYGQYVKNMVTKTFFLLQTFPIFEWPQAYEIPDKCKNIMEDPAILKQM